MLGEKNEKRLKALLIKGASIPLKAIPLWVSAIGAGVFMSNVVKKNPAFRERLGEINDKVFLFEAKDIKKSFYMHIKDRSIKIVPHMAGKPDVAMRGNFDVLTELLLGRVDPDTVFFSRKLEITGDTASAVHFKSILAALG